MLTTSARTTDRAHTLLIAPPVCLGRSTALRPARESNTAERGGQYQNHCSRGGQLVPILQDWLTRAVTNKTNAENVRPTVLQRPQPKPAAHRTRAAPPRPRARARGVDPVPAPERARGER